MPAKKSPPAKKGRTARVIARDGFRCWLCGRELAPARVTVDHIVSRERGGSNKPGNIALAHERCNRAKGDSLLIELGVAPVSPFCF